MIRRPLAVLLVLLAGCATAFVATEAVLSPTLRIGNWTDDQINVTIEGRTLVRVGAMQSVCFRLASLPPGSVTLVLRALASPGGMRSQPVDYALAEHWELDISSATSDGGFAPSATLKGCK